MLTSEQRTELDAVMRKRRGNAALARRARCVLLWADGQRRVDIRSKLACNDAFVSRWTSAFAAQGLARLVKNIASERGHADPALVQAFFDAGWTEGNLVDAIAVIGEKTVTNDLHGATKVPVDFPPAPALS